MRKFPENALFSAPLPDSSKQGTENYMVINVTEASVPHDGSYKLLFSHPEMVESLIRDFVPDEWVRELDFSTLERQNSSYVTDDLHERHNDILWRIKCRDTWLYIYLLIEFQSRVDPWMSVRIMTYIGLLYQDLIKSEHIKSGDRLPPVFPLVLYNGRKTWTASPDIAELISPAPAALARYRPRLRYFLVDEGRIPVEALDADSLTACLMRMERSTGTESVREEIAALKKILPDKKYQALRRAFAVWINRVLLKRLKPEEPIPEVNDLEEVDTMLAENVVEWTEQWKMEGLQKGRMEGRSAVLSRLLAKRFGPESKDDKVQERLRTADPEQLDLWAERILDAKTIDEVFDE
jgi:predicted transposase/invertase (TIGR01784 family)